MAALRIMSPVPWISALVGNNPTPPNVAVYRDAKASRRPRDLNKLLVGALSVSDKECSVLVGGKSIFHPPAHRPDKTFERFRALASTNHRIRAQKRVISAWCFACASGGFPYPQNPLRISVAPMSVLVLHTGCPQLQFCEESVLYTDERGEVLADKVADEWKQVATRILSAAVKESEKKRVKLWLRIPPLGAFLYHDFFTAIVRKGEVVQLACRGLRDAIRENFESLKLDRHLDAIELTDFSEEGFYTMDAEFVKECEDRGLVIAQNAVDALSPLPPGRQLAVAIAGDAAAVPGNSLAYGSVESMVANNTDFRRNATWIYNHGVLDPSNHDTL